jgi:hypothetical protein
VAKISTILGLETMPHPEQPQQRENMIARFIKEPLLHFLVGGLALFFVYEAIAPTDMGEDENTIIVDEATLLSFVKYRTRNFDDAAARNRVAALSDKALDTLIQDYIREEALHREAIALAMDDDDYIIRRRLVQKVEYIAQGLAEDVAAPSQQDVEAFYTAQSAQYAIDPSLTFTHIYFSAERHGWEEARQLVTLKHAELMQGNVGFSEAGQHGDHFPYHLNYVDRTPDYIASHFGQPMAEALLGQTAGTKTWLGPFRSDHGTHLVMLTRNVAAHTPALEEIRSQVYQDVVRAQIKERTERSIQDIIDRFDQQILYARPQPAP